ncbi:MAG: cytochrome-c peroxidase [Alphaproteobacteria bacterium]|nr:cytochrome-c peroxidase [Alphaproteobacteria bacterium]
MSRLLLLSFLAACGSSDTKTPEPTQPEATPEVHEAPKNALIETASKIFAPLPEKAESAKNPITEAKVSLGRTLYFDKRLSKNHDISCNSCHQLDKHGVDNEPTSPGHKGVRGGRNSPTVYNAALHTAQFWDGRAADVEEQAKGPVLNPVEMAMPDEAYVLTVLNSIPGYGEMFKAAFPEEADPVTYDNFGKAVGAFERQLLTPAPFDAFLAGDATALNAQQQKGLQAFIDVGCASCHNGAALGGMTYMKLGMVQPYETADKGRFDVTGNEADTHVFKVPSLRNIAKTGPYLHDGSVASLDEMVRIMGKHQLGRELTEEQVTDIVEFLGALTGTPDADYIAEPPMPESGPDTPAPNPA